MYSTTLNPKFGCHSNENIDDDVIVTSHKNALYSPDSDVYNIDLGIFEAIRKDIVILSHKTIGP